LSNTATQVEFAAMTAADVSLWAEAIRINGVDARD
jgi:hypothetical protein